jgi:hypothetical protein
LRRVWPIAEVSQAAPGQGKSDGGAKVLATKFLQIFHGNYFGFPAGNPIFATRSKSRLSGTSSVNGWCGSSVGRAKD